MNDKILWTNRIITGIVCVIAILICEKFKFSPCWCFTIAFLTIMGLSFVFAIVERILG